MGSCRDAAITLWGPAGEYAHDSYSRLRSSLYPDLPTELPIVIGITAYGRCLGLTRSNWVYGPRITLASSLFAQGHRAVDDVLTHELVHVRLRLAGRHPTHDSADWYAEIRRLSPMVLGIDLDATRGGDRQSVRMPNPRAGEEGQPATVVRKVRVAEAVPHKQVAGWPGSFRPPHYDRGDPIDCPTY